MPIPDPLEPGGRAALFVSRAEALGIDYNIIEAYDQPWKTFEGGVGPYWGLFDTSRAAEILLDRADHQSGSLEAHRDRGADRRAAVAADPGADRRDRSPRPRCSPPPPISTGAWFAILFAYWNGHYFVPGAAFAFGARAACC